MKPYSYIKRLRQEYYYMAFFSRSLFLLKHNFISTWVLLIGIHTKGALLIISGVFFLFFVDLELLRATGDVGNVISPCGQLVFSSRLFVFENAFSSVSIFNF
jgi:hypothetical protein